MSVFRLALAVFGLSATMATSASAEPASEPYSKLVGRDCVGTSICHITFPKVRKGFRLDVETISCVTTTALNNPVTFQGFYVADESGENVALYGVTPQLVGKNDVAQFFSFNQQGFMPVFTGQTPRVETYRAGSGPTFTNNCTISGQMVKLK